MSNNNRGEIKLSEIQPNHGNNDTTDNNTLNNDNNNSGSKSPENPDDRTLNPHDSLTLGQLKRIIKQHHNQKNSNYSEQKGYIFNYDLYLDLPVEINEFYSYTEVSRHLEGKNYFEENAEDWQNFDITKNRSQVEIWLEMLETSDRTERFKASMCLLYLAQGQFFTKTSSQAQLDQLIINNKKLREYNALSYYYSGLKIACGNHDKLAQTYWTGSTIDINKMSEVNLEIGLMLSLLYLFIEVNRTQLDDGFDLELANLDPSLPQFLFGLVAKLKEKSFKGYPIKKVLLLLWKVLLTINGDFNSLKDLKKYSRLKNGLPLTKSDNGTNIKVNPEEYNLYYWEIMHKYPAAFSSLRSDPFLKASPMNTKWVGDGPRPAMPNITNIPNMSLGSFYSNSIVPTPTPFIYPKNPSKNSQVPRPIREAVDLYDNNLEFSLSHLQIIKEQDQANSGGKQPKKKQNNLEELFQAENKQFNKFEAQLDRIDALYKAILPDAHSIVVILLKLLLATIPNSKPGDSSSSNGDNGNGQNIQLIETTPSHLSIEEVDDIRHKEIVAKSVSAILLLLLKQFKASHVLRYEYWCTLLVDTNAILLILKMYGLQDFQTLVTVRNECDHMGFFRALIPNLQNDQTQLKSQIDSSNPNEILLGRGRNLFTSINFFRILNKLCKRKLTRLLLLIQFKSSAILKRGIKINHQLLNKYILKVIQQQVPYLGRKWRQSNMKIITLIYLNFNNKLGLREDWLLPGEIDQYSEIQQNNLRNLIVGYHRREFGITVLNSLQSHPSISDLVQSPSNSGSNSHLMHDNHHQIHLDEEFMANYDVWLESEVFNNENNEVDDLHLNDPDFWTVSTTEDEDELEDFDNLSIESGEELDNLSYIDPDLIDSGIKRPPSPPLLI